MLILDTGSVKEAILFGNRLFRVLRKERSWRNIPLALIIPEKGERRAPQSGENACFRQWLGE